MKLRDFLLERRPGELVVMNDIAKIANSNRPAYVSFESGERTKVPVSSAAILVATYQAMTISQQKRFDELIGKNKRNFENTLRTIYRKIGA